MQPWLREWAAIEREASELRYYNPLLFSGLLQTEEYARAVFLGANQFLGDELEKQITARMHRQEVLTGPTPPRFIFVFDEGVLHRPIGGPKVMRDQLNRLLEVAEWEHVTLQVVPAIVGAYPGLKGFLSLATVPDGDEVAYMDNALQGTYAQRATDVRQLLSTWEAVRAEAFSPHHTLSVIKEAVQTWT